MLRKRKRKAFNIFERRKKRKMEELKNSRKSKKQDVSNENFMKFLQNLDNKSPTEDDDFEFTPKKGKKKTRKKSIKKNLKRKKLKKFTALENYKSLIVDFLSENPKKWFTTNDIEEKFEFSCVISLLNLSIEDKIHKKVEIRDGRSLNKYKYKGKYTKKPKMNKQEKEKLKKKCRKAILEGLKERTSNTWLDTKGIFQLAKRNNDIFDVLTIRTTLKDLVNEEKIEEEKDLKDGKLKIFRIAEKKKKVKMKKKKVEDETEDTFYLEEVPKGSNIQSDEDYDEEEYEENEESSLQFEIESKEKMIEEIDEDFYYFDEIITPKIPNEYSTRKLEQVINKHSNIYLYWIEAQHNYRYFVPISNKGNLGIQYPVFLLNHKSIIPPSDIFTGSLNQSFLIYKYSEENRQLKDFKSMEHIFEDLETETDDTTAIKKTLHLLISIINPLKYLDYLHLSSNYSLNDFVYIQEDPKKPFKIYLLANPEKKTIDSTHSLDRILKSFEKFLKEKNHNIENTIKEVRMKECNFLEKVELLEKLATKFMKEYLKVN